MLQPLSEMVSWFLTKLNIFLPYYPAVILLTVYPNELKTYVHVKPAHSVYSSFIHHYQAFQNVLQVVSG